MIPDYFIFFFIFIILAWFFAGRDEYLLPQIALMAAVVIETMIYISGMTLDATISDVAARYLIMIAPVLLYLTNFFYIVANMTISKPETKGKKE